MFGTMSNDLMSGKLKKLAFDKQQLIKIVLYKVGIESQVAYSYLNSTL